MADDAAQVQDTEDFDIEDRPLVGENTTETESTQDQQEPADEQETSKDEGTEETQEQSTEDESGEKDEQPDQKEQARQAYAQRQAAKQEKSYIQNLRDKAREYEQSVDPNDAAARVTALENQFYIREIEANRNNLVDGDSRAKANIPLFNPTSNDFNEVAYNAAMQKFASTYLVTDEETGEVLGAYDPRTNTPVDLYQYLKTEADVYEQVGQAYSRKGQQAAMQMQQRAVTPPASAPRGNSDSLEDLESRIGDIPLV